MSENLSLNLQYLMKMHGGLSVSELARQTKVPQPTLHHILNGVTKKPRVEALEALATFFSVPIAQLVGSIPLLPVIPDIIKESLKIASIPIIEWEMIKKWPNIDCRTLGLREIFLDKKVHKNSFGLIVNNTKLEPLFPEKSVLVFDAGKMPKDRDFVITYFSQRDTVVFNRLFVEKTDCYLKHDQEDGNAQLIKINPTSDTVIASLIEVRLQF